MTYKASLLLFFLNVPLLLFSQHVEVVKYEDLDKIMEDKTFDIHVINFWATWCKPCIKEIPYFEAVNKKYEGNSVKVLLVSLDFAEELESKVLPFIKKRNLKSDVKLLDETDFNNIINRIDSSWSGAIPATLIINNLTGKKEFFEKEFQEGELDMIIQRQLD